LVIHASEDLSQILMAGGFQRKKRTSRHACLESLQFHRGLQPRNTIPFCYGSRSGGDDALNHSRFFVIAGGEGSIQRQRRLRRSASDRNNASAPSSSHSWAKSRSRSGQDRKFVRIPDNLGDQFHITRTVLQATNVGMFSKLDQ